MNNERLKIAKELLRIADEIMAGGNETVKKTNNLYNLLSSPKVTKSKVRDYVKSTSAASG